MPVRSSPPPLWQTALLAAANPLAGGLDVHGHCADSAALFYGGLLGMAAATGPAAFALGRGRWPDGVLITGICVAISVPLFVASELAWRAMQGSLAPRVFGRIVGRIRAG